jgi:hypothetical protein
MGGAWYRFPCVAPFFVVSLKQFVMNLRSCLSLTVAIVASTKIDAAPEATAWLDAYNVVWTEPGTKALHSMPSGGGNIALNVWTTRDALLFYIASADSWNGQTQVKMGRVRLTLSPNPFTGTEFRQEHRLADNSIHVSGKATDGTKVNLRVHVDALQPVVHVEGKSNKPINVTAALELTGHGDGRLDQDAAVWRFRIDGPSPQRQDLIVKNHVGAIAASVPDPMENHTWGGRLTGDGFVAGQQAEAENEGQRTQSWSLKSRAPSKNFHLRAVLRIAKDPTVEEWEKQLSALDAKTKANTKDDQDRSADWWKEFWNRSHIVINPGKNVSDPAWETGRNYQLFRAMLAANRSGNMPTLFNGGPFIMEATPNERQWGHAGFTAQNQRLVHWPMLKSGDADLLKVGLEFYRERHGLALAWAKHFWGIDGAVFHEDIDLFGLPVYTTKDGSGHTDPACLRYHYISGMEFALMMLQSASYFGTDVRPYVPVADGMLRFFDQFYRKQHQKKSGQELDANDRLVIYPGNAVESHIGTTNDAPTVAGLTALSDTLLALPSDIGSAEQRAFWKSFRAQLPPVPVHEWKGKRQIAPATSWESQRPDFNMELPHLYPVFPFRLYGVGLPDLDIARNAFHHGDTCSVKQKGHFCWYQAGIFAAGLGLTDIARDYTMAKFLHPRMGDPVEGKDWEQQKVMSPWELRWTRKDWELPRYPAFWDSMIFCGRPDMDHGGAAMVQLQEMLLQTPGDALHLFPAWPAEWDVDFKLHAPQKTVVEGVLRNGKLVSLKVTPESRAKDVVNWLGKVPPDARMIDLGGRKPITASSTYHEPGYEAAKANDNDLMTRWASANDASEGSLTIDLGAEQYISRVWLAEINFAHTREFVIEVQQGNAWKEVARGTSIGPDCPLEFAPAKAKAIRLRIIKSDGPINLNEFQVFADSASK